MPMDKSVDLIQTMKELIVEALMLEDIEPQEIETDAALFGDGLGLDSVDALELAIAIDKRFGVRVDAEDERTKQIFQSVRSLSTHVAENMGTEGAKQS